MNILGNLRNLGLVVGLAALAACGVTYTSPTVKSQAAGAKVRVVALSTQSVLLANREPYVPRSLPEVFYMGTGGGTVVRGDVLPGALAVSSGPMRVIDGWAEEKRAGTAQGEAAAAARRTPDDHDVTDPSSQPPARDLG